VIYLATRAADISIQRGRAPSRRGFMSIIELSCPTINVIVLLKIIIEWWDSIQVAWGERETRDSKV